jgi:hypothetical protein
MILNLGHRKMNDPTSLVGIPKREGKIGNFELD